jgi:hypothetical protein
MPSRHSNQSASLAQLAGETAGNARPRPGRPKLAALMVAGMLGGFVGTADAFVPMQGAPANQAMTPVALPALGVAPSTPMPALAAAKAATAGSAGRWASVSGLSWRSGSACLKSGWEGFRNRRNDVYIEFAGRNRFAEVVRLVKSYHVSRYRSMPGRLSLGLPMLTNDVRARWQDCISGKFDRHFREIGLALKNGGLGDAIIRLGWEANGSGFPWNIKGQVEAYKACFRREVNVLKSAAPGLQIDWNMKKNTEGPVGAHMLYPGDQYVDIIGVNYYDQYPRFVNQATWDKYHNSMYKGGPRGLGSWIKFAKARGKKLSLPEWGVWNESRGGDNPFFIQKMHETFKRNAGVIAYEGYFNCSKARHRLYTAGINPKSSAMYKQLWSRGG